MHIIKAARVGLVILIGASSTCTFAATLVGESAIQGVYMYTQPTEKSQRTTIEVAPSNMTVVSLGRAWLKAKPKRPLPLWVNSGSVVLHNGEHIDTGMNPIAAYLAVPNAAEQTPGNAAWLPKNSQFLIMQRKGNWLRIEDTSDVELWVSSEAYLSATYKNKNALVNRPEIPVDNTTSAYLDWLCSQSASGKTLQLASFKQSTDINAYLSRHPQLDNSNLKYAKSFDGEWHYLLYGSYSDDNQASGQLELLNLSRTAVSIRSFEYLQSKRCVDRSFAGT